ncbi:MAG: glycosyltransferase family 2 protein [Polyangiales bacterium]
MRLLCVILNYRTADMTLEAAESARKALALVDGDHLIHIVDNDSGDGSFEKISAAVAERGWPKVRVSQSGKNGGFGAGNNFAIRKALASDDPPDYVYILNSDAFPAEDAVRVLIDFMERTPDAGLAGSYIHGTDGEPHLTAFRFPSLRGEVLSGFRLGALQQLWPDVEVPIQPMPTESRAVDWVAGASLIVRREVFETIGLFDETFFLYFEETDLCRRAALAGHRCYYVVESRVAHVGSASTGLKDQSSPMPRYWFDSRSHYFKKNHGLPYTVAANVGYALGLGTFRARALVQRKDNPDRKHFLRDFVRYNFFNRES